MSEVLRGHISDILFDALTLIENDPSSWPTLTGRMRNLLLDRNLVNVEGEMPLITDLGQQAMATHIPRVKIPGITASRPVEDDHRTPTPSPVQAPSPRVQTPSPVQAPSPRVQQFTYPIDITTASEADLMRAADTIGLKAKNGGLARTLRFIESTIANRTLDEIEQMALRVEVRVRFGKAKTDDMKKRRTLAAIYNAGKLAQAI